jgi:peptidoglycan/xylan/chitin deacetylase (PgdA/CDA1 family)
MRDKVRPVAVCNSRGVRLLALVAVVAVLASGCDSTSATRDDAAPDPPGPTPTGLAPPSTDPPADPGSRAEAALPACAVPARLTGQDLARLPVTGRFVALTFDAGANSDGVPSILATLSERKAPATFFLTGSFVRTFPKRSLRIGRQYLVGNHTDTHKDVTKLTDRAVTQQVRTAERSILQVTGQDPRRFFRFPYGARTPHAITVLNGLCYVPFRWTVDTLGWKGTSTGQSVASVVARVMAAAAPGAIVLMHVGSHPQDHSTLDADALPTVIRRLRQAGFTLVRLSRIMSSAP